MRIDCVSRPIRRMVAGAGRRRATDLRCDIKGADGRTHADLGMTGEIVIE